ncbi:MAG TPA: phenylalanine--tRNA ligase subunit beta [Tepidisphaeraceae bacterium]|jgi:phenylalanyl-tRNA synthetase beta chain|nr:phenylalanine--tRNA ligase subunit beta [Tepidisphaeraceae bacterium]
MKISLQWLADYLPGPLAATEAADALTFGGLPVEVIETVRSPQGEDDTVIDVEVTSNRGDCLSHVGVARELGALLSRETQAPAPKLKEATEKTADAIGVTIEATNLCPHYVARVIRGVKIGPSPAWMQRRLLAVGLRPINNVVDVTNYVMFELGQPLHAFDYDKVGGKQIVVRNARAGEKLISIDGHERALSPNMLVIADANQPVALAGVMGGRDSEVSDGTVNVLLEAARFDPLSIRTTARALTMASDGSYRFERGIDPTLPHRAAARAAELIVELAGGEVLAGTVDAGQAPAEPKKLAVRLSRIRRITGFDIPPTDAVAALSRLGLSPISSGDAINVIVPPHRLDINIEADLVEEVVRVIGYDKIPVSDTIGIRVTPANPELRTIDRLRSILTAAGYFEAVTFSFVSDALAGAFVPTEAASLPRAHPAVRKTDAHLRPSVLPGLLQAVRHNEANDVPNARLFEIGAAFWHDRAGKIVERRRVALVGSKDLREVRGVVETILNTLDASRPVTVSPADAPGYAKGAAGQVKWGDEVVGVIGLIDGTVANKIDLKQPPAAAELELAPLLAGARLVPQLRPLPKYPAVRRDLSLVLAEVVRFEQVREVIATAKPENLEDVEFVTTYRGKPLDKGTKSLTVTLVFRSTTGTLTGEQVEAAVTRVTDAARSTLGATLRT